MKKLFFLYVLHDEIESPLGNGLDMLFRKHYSPLSSDQCNAMGFRPEGKCRHVSICLFQVSGFHATLDVLLEQYSGFFQGKADIDFPVFPEALPGVLNRQHCLLLFKEFLKAHGVEGIKNFIFVLEIEIYGRWAVSYLLLSSFFQFNNQNMFVSGYDDLNSMRLSLKNPKQPP